MNPARVFGPAVVGNEWHAHWVWWISEIVGACLAVVVVRMLFAPLYSSDPDQPSPIWWWRLFQHYNGVHMDSTGNAKVGNWSVMYAQRHAFVQGDVLVRNSSLGEDLESQESQRTTTTPISKGLDSDHGMEITK